MDDKTLIKKINEGDRPAIRILVEQNKNLIWHIIISMVGRNHDSEDLFQEVFLRVFNGVKKFRADARLSTWIGSITHHVCVDYLRKQKKERDFLAFDTEGTVMINYSQDTSWKQTESEDINQLVLAAINKLPSEYRTLITLYHLDECSYRDIAEITGMPDGTVKSYISRARIMLREKLIALIPDLAEIREDF